MAHIFKTLRYIFTIDYSDVNPVRVVMCKFLYLMFERIGLPTVIVPINGYWMKLDLSTGGITRALFIYGKRELCQTMILKRVVMPGMNVLGIGANIGYYTCLVGNLNGRGKIFALEPDPRNLAILNDNIRLNRLKNRTTLLPIAAGNTNEIATLYLSEASNLSSIVKRSDSVGTVPVACIQVDKIDQLRKNVIHLIRMDIEGYECEAVPGMQKLLERSSDIGILMELHPETYTNKLDINGMLTLLENLGFGIRYLVSAGSKPVSIITSKYQAVYTAHEGHWRRAIFEHVSYNDLREFLSNRKKIVRAAYFEKRKPHNV